ncbi:uncharacterized protein LOC126336088 [Schistocerca gregaria]|uniref:uncharacterized protein LOC126336088 n=1 Tax=Schistocerca gregaria TaxID=7010 RepID=UPI00211ECC6A|nr:uncharacterized protein LOC126336088 [Schistocerca gregaria]
MARFANIWCMSPTTEILTIGALGFVHAGTQCYWYFGEGKTDRILGAVDTKGYFTSWEEKIIQSALHGMEFMKNALTPLHLLFYLLMFHALLFVSIIPEIFTKKTI